MTNPEFKQLQIDVEKSENIDELKEVILSLLWKLSYLNDRVEQLENPSSW